jgi:hypothetical protein
VAKLIAQRVLEVCVAKIIARGLETENLNPKAVGATTALGFGLRV